MKNTHLEHPEDSVLESRDAFLQVLDFFREQESKISVKWDGAPAIVFGHNPENHKRFVGTKSVFNKRKIKINYTHHDIETNHGDNEKVASILHTCLECLPDKCGVWQGDFLGFGGTDTLTPNTITYKFDQEIKESIVVAIHTNYTGTKMSEMVADFNCDYDAWSLDNKVKYVKTDATITSRRKRIDYLIRLAGATANLIRFPSEQKGKQLKIEVNRCIREQRDISSAGMGVIRTSLYKLMIHIKELIMEGIESAESVECAIMGEPTTHEGFVMTNKFGTYKLVNRREFSHANFTVQKQWDK
jgi:hypothetical protein